MNENPPPPERDPVEDTQALPLAEVLGRVGADRRGGPPKPERQPWRPMRRLSGLGCLLLFVTGLALGAAVALLFLRHRRSLPKPPQPAAAPAAAPVAPPAETAPAGPRLVFAPTNVRPENTPDILESGLPEVFCFFDVPDAAASAKATIRWVIGEGAGVDTGSQVTKEQSDHLRGSARLKPPQGQPAFADGIYEAELLVDGARVVEGSFVALKGGEAMLRPEPGMERSRPEVKALVVSAGAPPAAPQAPFVLPANPPKVIVSFQYAYALPGTAFTVYWLYDGGLIQQATTEITIQKDSGTAEAWFAPKPPATLPVGKYAVVVGLAEGTPPLAQESFWIGRQPRADERVEHPEGSESAPPVTPAVPAEPPPAKPRRTRPWSR